MFAKAENRLANWLARRAIAKQGKREWFSGLLGTNAASGFAGGGVNRLTASLAQASGSVNADLDGQLVILRARARSLAANNEFAKHFLSLVAANVVGPHGPTLQVRAMKDQLDPKKPTTLDKAANDAIESHWRRWGKAADITGRMTLAHLLRTAAKAVARDGEAIIRVVRNKSLPYGIALQILEADRLDIELNRKLSGGGSIRQGVEIDGVGRPAAYWLRASHPGDQTIGAKDQVERVLAGDIYHLFVPERAEQVRGYTWFHAVLVRAAQLQGFEESAVVAARVGASKIAALIPGEDASGNPGHQMADAKDAVGNFQINAEAGDLIQLPQGYSLESWDPQYPHENFGAFVNQCLRAIAMGFDVAAHNLSGNMAEVNYSSARIAELAEREIWMMLQGWLIDAFMVPLYRDWLQSSLVLGAITFEISGKSLPADKFSKFADASAFRGRRWQWVDPLKDASASEKLIQLGLASRTELAASQGRDFEDIVDELKQEREMLEAAGLPGIVGEVPAPEEAPTDDNADTTEVIAATAKAAAQVAAAVSSPTIELSPLGLAQLPIGEVMRLKGEAMSSIVDTISEDKVTESRAREKDEQRADAIAEAVATQTHALQIMLDAQVKQMAELVEIRREMRELAAINAADRVPVFDADGNPIRATIDIESGRRHLQLVKGAA